MSSDPNVQVTFSVFENTGVFAVVVGAVCQVPQKCQLA